ncbi:MAG TPA: DinB family protein [Thermodesulfobacteriota bacterium]|nr:DinB family protein [Thermodesulfobacteriota bacterium]
MDRNQVIRRVDAGWEAFRDSYSGLSVEKLLEPGPCGEWSVRDIIAHVTWWEEEALKHLPLILKGGTPPRYSFVYGGIDAFNALMTERKKGLSLSEVLREQADTHRRLLKYLVTVPEAQLTGETRFRRRLRLDTYGHYKIHAQAIRKLREQDEVAADTRRA